MEAYCRVRMTMQGRLHQASQCSACFSWCLLYARGDVLAQVVAAVGANGQHDNGLNIAFNYVIPIGFLVGGILFTKW